MPETAIDALVFDLEVTSLAEWIATRTVVR